MFHGIRASHAGVGTFNNNFKVADDIRMLGAVPEEEDEREVRTQPVVGQLWDVLQRDVGAVLATLLQE